MMKKSAAPAGSPPLSSRRHLLWMTWKLIIAASITLCFFVFLKLQRYSIYDVDDDDHAISSSLSLPAHRRHSIRSRDSGQELFVGNPRIAFLFLTRRHLPLDFLWGSFFENGDVANFTIYVHSEPGFVFNESTTRSTFFHNRQLENSIKVGWGESTMIEAERLLLEVALENPSNQKFVLLSDSCVPLYNFSYVYNYLMASERSFVDSFLDKKGKEERYNPKMSPVIPRNKWRKGSQWIALTRRHAEEVVDDEIIFSVFWKFCERRPLVDPYQGRKNLKLQQQHNCIPDEHYVQTLLAMKNLEGELERRTLTYTQWNESTSHVETKGWHPVTFGYSDASPQEINGLKDINHVYYETEYRTEWCRTNSTPVPCFLFARKFSQGAAMRLLSEGTVGQFEASMLLNSLP